MAKKNTYTTKPKGDIDFEKELWDVANELRGAVAENQYKDYVLSLLFLKYLSERYEIRRQEIQLSFFEDPAQYGFPENGSDNVSGNVETPYRASLPAAHPTTNANEIENPFLSELLEDELEYQVKNVYKLPKEATWTYLRENAEQDDIKVKVDKAFVLIDEILAERNPDYKGVLEPIFVKSQLSPTQVSGLINLCSQNVETPYRASLPEINNPESDIYGRVYEYYIGKFKRTEGSGAGQFFTPGSVVRLLVEMIEPPVETQDLASASWTWPAAAAACSCEASSSGWRTAAIKTASAFTGRNAMKARKSLAK